MTALLCLALFGAPHVVARVNDVAITGDEIQVRVQAMARSGAKPTAQIALDDLVDEVLLAGEGNRMGLAHRPEVKSVLETERRRLASDRHLEVDLANVKVDDKLLSELFHDAADQVQLQIVVLSSREQAQAAFDRLKSKSTDFATEARSTLAESERKSGGQRAARRGALEPALRELAFGAPLGELLGPIDLPLGFAVFKVLSRDLGTDKELATRREPLRRFAKEQARSQAKAHYVQQLRKQHHAVLDEAFIDGMPKNLEVSAADAARPVATIDGKPIPYGVVVDELRRMFGPHPTGHALGPTVKKEFAWKLVDQQLLANAALARGFGADRKVLESLRRVEREAIARMTVAMLRQSGGDSKLRNRVTELRAAAKIAIDDESLKRVVR